MFEVDFYCPNCGYEWTERFEKGDEVSATGAGPFLTSHTCIGRQFCNCRTIRCPNCDVSSARSHSQIRARRPVRVVDAP